MGPEDLEDLHDPILQAAGDRIVGIAAVGRKEDREEVVVVVAAVVEEELAGFVAESFVFEEVDGNRSKRAIDQ